MSENSPYWRAIPWGIFVLFIVRFPIAMDKNLKEKQIGKKAKDFLRVRAFLLACWWKCRTKRCDYYQVYQALGAPDLTHIGYHAAERMALEHCGNCTIRMDRECETCKAWAERLRGEAWVAIMGKRSEVGERLIEEKKKPYGFYSEAGPND
jgi:hypothetical protein